MSIFKKSNTRKGFSLAEVIIVVAIIGILLAVAIPNVISYYRALKITELDDSARTIFLAAQNKLTALVNEGQNLETTVGGNSKPAIGGVAYLYISNDKTTTPSNDGLHNILPAGSVDLELQNYNYVIEYSPETGAVYAVWYWEKGDFSYKSNYSADDALKANRLKNNQMVGYYGGTTIDRVEVGQMPIPGVDIINAEELKLTVKVPSMWDSLGTSEGMGYSNNILVDVLVDGKPILEKANLWDGNGYVGTVILDTLKTSYPNTGDSSSGEINWTVGDQFKKWKTEKGLTTVPGDDMVVTVKLYYNGALSDRRTLLPQYVSVKANSLFAGVKDDASGNKIAQIAYGRHLQNLDTVTSGVEGIAGAEQIRSIDFKDDVNVKDVYSWEVTYGHDAHKFVPITADADFTAYNGNGLAIRNLNLKGDKDSYVGLFGTAANVTFNDVVLIDTVAEHGGSVGALAGYAASVTANNCRVYLEDLSDKDNPRLKADGTTAAPTVGGLFGGTIITTINNSSASTIAFSNDYAGGLVGSDFGNVTINQSYAACYLKGAHVGGLVGTTNSAAGVEISNSYAAGLIESTTVGDGEKLSGFSGLVNISSGSPKITNSYSAVRFVNINSLIKNYSVYGTVKGDTATNNNFYVRQAGVPYGKEFDGDGNETPPGTDDQAVSTSELKAKVGSSPFDATDVWYVPATGATNPDDVTFAYELKDETKIVKLTIPYPYPMLAADGEVVPQYGDWLEEETSGALMVYFEKYDDGSYGFYAARLNAGSGDAEVVINTLKSKDAGATIVSDGYRIVSTATLDGKDYTIDGTKPTSSPLDEAEKNGNTDIATALEGSTDAEIKAYVNGGEVFVYTPALDSTPVNYYHKLVIGSDEVTLFYNPHFACEAFDATERIKADQTLGTSFIKSKPGAAGNGATITSTKDFNGEVVIRTARQLAYVGLYTNDTDNARRTAAQARQYHQVMDIDYNTYLESNMPARTDDFNHTPAILSGVSGATFGYDGHECVIWGLKPSTIKSADGNSEYSGLFGTAENGTLQNIQLVNTTVSVGDGSSGGTGTASTTYVLDARELTAGTSYTNATAGKVDLNAGTDGFFGIMWRQSGGSSDSKVEEEGKTWSYDGKDVYTSKQRINFGATVNTQRSAIKFEINEEATIKVWWSPTKDNGNNLKLIDKSGNQVDVTDETVAGPCFYTKALNKGTYYVGSNSGGIYIYRIEVTVPSTTIDNTNPTPYTPPVSTGELAYSTLAGSVKGATVTNCGAYVEADATATTPDAAYDKYVVENKTSGSKDAVGGLIGAAVSSTIQQSFAAVKVTGSSTAGGFAGKLTSGSVTDCYVGGHTVKGTFGNGTDVKINVSTTDTSNLTYTGGFVGQVSGTTFNSVNYTTASVGMANNLHQEGANKDVISTIGQFAGDGEPVTGAKMNLYAIGSIFRNSDYFPAGSKVKDFKDANKNDLYPVRNEDYLNLSATLANPASSTAEPYDELYIDNNSGYPYQMTDGQTVHHGDWTERFNFIYYEVYDKAYAGGDKGSEKVKGIGTLTTNDDVKAAVGFYAVIADTSDPSGKRTINTLKTEGFVYDSGYMILSNSENSNIVFSITSYYGGKQNVGTATYFDLTSAIDNTDDIIADQNSKPLAKYLYVIPFDAINLAPSDTFYEKVTINGQPYMLNQYFACEAVNVDLDLDGDGKMDYNTIRVKPEIQVQEINRTNQGGSGTLLPPTELDTSDHKTVIIRSPWHLASMARYTREGNTATAIRNSARTWNFVQLLNVDYEKYAEGRIFDGNPNTKFDGKSYSGTMDMFGQCSAMLGAVINGTPTKGTFNGFGHTISNVYFGSDSGDTSQYVGLFGAVDCGSTVKQVVLKNVYLNGNGGDPLKGIYVGSVVARLLGGSTVEKVSLQNVKMNFHKVPTLVEKKIGGETVDCWGTTGEAKFNAIGGVVGQVVSGNVDNVFVDGLSIELDNGKDTVKYYDFHNDQKLDDYPYLPQDGNRVAPGTTGGTYLGSSVRFKDETKEDSSTGKKVVTKAKSEAIRIGGAIGDIDTTLESGAKASVSNMYLRDVYVNANKADKNYVGGVIGRADGKAESDTFNIANRNITIKNSGVYLNITTTMNDAAVDELYYNNTGVVSTSTDDFTGGFIGRSDHYVTISDCFSALRVQGVSSVGGFAGHIEGSAIQDCYSGGHTRGGNYVLDDATKANVSTASESKALVGGFAGKIELSDDALDMSGVNYTTCSVYAPMTSAGDPNQLGLFMGAESNADSLNNYVKNQGSNLTLYSVAYAVNEDTDPDDACAELTEEKYLKTGIDVPPPAGVVKALPYDKSITSTTYPYTNETQTNIEGNNPDAKRAHYGDWVKVEAVGVIYWEVDHSGDIHWHGYRATTDGRTVAEVASTLCNERDGKAIVQSGYAWFTNSAATLSVTGGGSAGGETSAQMMDETDIPDGLRAIIGTDSSMYGVYSLAENGNGSYETWSIKVDGHTDPVSFFVNPAYGNAVKAEKDKNRYNLGTGSWPYEIRTLAQLDNITSDGINTANKTFKQTHDLVGGTDGDSAYIHTPGVMNGGTFDGGFYRILYLDITPGSGDAALFSVLKNNATVKNAILYNPEGTGEITSTGGSAAGIAADMQGGSIQNTVVAGYTVNGKTNSGGLVGTVTAGSNSVTGSQATVDTVIPGTDGGSFGGLVGSVSGGRLSVSKSYAGGNIATADGVTLNNNMTNMGGIVGSKGSSATVTYDTVYSYVNMSEKVKFSDTKVGSTSDFQYVTFYGIGPGVDTTKTDTIGYWGGGVPDVNTDDRDLSRGLADLAEWHDGNVASEVYIPSNSKKSTDGLKDLAATNPFPFGEYVSESGKPVHYGDWPQPNGYAGLFYWEEEQITDASGVKHDPEYHFYAYGIEVVDSKMYPSELVDSLCHDHHIGERGTILDSGYGYFVPRPVGTNGAEDPLITFGLKYVADKEHPEINADGLLFSDGNTEWAMSADRTQSGTNYSYTGEVSKIVDSSQFPTNKITYDKTIYDGLKTELLEELHYSVEASKDYDLVLLTSRHPLFYNVKDYRWELSAGTETFQMLVRPTFGAAVYDERFDMGEGNDDNIEEVEPMVLRMPQHITNIQANAEVENKSLDYFVLGHDIDFLGEDGVTPVKVYDKDGDPIDYQPVNFYSQILDGKGYRILDLNISVTSGDAALFTLIREQTKNEIKNVIMYSTNGAVIETESGNAAGLIIDSQKATISNCIVSGYTIKGTKYVGGIVANPAGASSIKNCAAVNDLVGLSDSAKLGGIAGKASSTINNCYTGGSASFDSSVTPTSSAVMAGIVADGAATNSYTYMKIGSAGSAKTYPISDTPKNNDGSKYLTGTNFYNGTVDTSNEKATAVTDIGDMPGSPKANYSYKPSYAAGTTATQEDAGKGMKALRPGLGYPFQAVVKPMKMDGKDIYVHYGPWPDGKQGVGAMYWEKYEDGTFGAHVIGLDDKGNELTTNTNTLCDGGDTEANGNIHQHRVVANGVATFTTSGDAAEITIPGVTASGDDELITGLAELAGDAVGGTLSSLNAYDLTNYGSQSTDDVSKQINVTVSGVGTPQTVTFAPGFADIYDSGVTLGTDADHAYNIRTVRQLDNVIDGTVGAGKYYEQTHDVYGQGYTGYTAPYLENVHYDGGSHRILELSISAKEDVGLFRSSVGSELANIVLYSPSGSAVIEYTGGAADGENKSVGGLIGYVIANNPGKTTTITNCAVAGYTLMSADENVGGLVGNASEALTITKSQAVNNLVSNTDTEKGNTFGMGGLVGYVGGAAVKITDSYAGGSISREITEPVVGGLYGGSGTNVTVTGSYTYVDMSELEKDNVCAMGPNYTVSSTDNYYFKGTLPDGAATQVSEKDYNGLRDENGGKPAQYTYIPNETEYGVSGWANNSTDKYEFKAAISDTANRPVHYGVKPAKPITGAVESAIFYWEKDQAGKYHVQFIAVRDDGVTLKGDTLSYVRDGQNIDSYGFGYVGAASITGTKADAADVNGVTEALKNAVTSAATELRKTDPPTVTKGETEVVGFGGSAKFTVLSAGSGTTSETWTAGGVTAVVNRGFAKVWDIEPTALEIRTYEQLKNISGVNNGIFKQSHDIDADGKTDYVPANLGTGSYNGGGYRIFNLSITGTGDNVGLFATANEGATIENVIMYANKSGVKISGNKNVGGILGNAEFNSKVVMTIKNCAVAGYEISGTEYIGGLVGYANRYDSSHAVEITNCEAVNDLKGNGSAKSMGGLVGFANSTKIDSCYAGGSITGEASSPDSIGGFFGKRNGDILVTNSYSYVDLTGIIATKNIYAIGNADTASSNNYYYNEYIKTGTTTTGATAFTQPNELTTIGDVGNSTYVNGVEATKESQKFQLHAVINNTIFVDESGTTVDVVEHYGIDIPRTLNAAGAIYWNVEGGKVTYHIVGVTDDGGVLTEVNNLCTDHHDDGGTIVESKITESGFATFTTGGTGLNVPSTLDGLSTTTNNVKTALETALKDMLRNTSVTVTLYESSATATTEQSFEVVSGKYVHYDPRFANVGVSDSGDAMFGTTANPVEIRTMQQLDNLSGNSVVKQTHDLYGAEITSYTGADFGGTYNGGGYKILNLKGAVFNKVTSGANISGIVLYSKAGGTITGTAPAGGIANQAQGDVTIDHCVVAGYNISASTGNVGGLVGEHHDGTLTITNSAAVNTLSGGTGMGGLVGASDGTSVVITSSYAGGAITGSGKIGGLVGSAGSATVSDSYSYVDLTGATGTVYAIGENANVGADVYYLSDNAGSAKGPGTGKSYDDLKALVGGNDARYSFVPGADGYKGTAQKFPFPALVEINGTRVHYGAWPDEPMSSGVFYFDEEEGVYHVQYIGVAGSKLQLGGALTEGEAARTGKGITSSGFGYFYKGSTAPTWSSSFGSSIGTEVDASGINGIKAALGDTGNGMTVVAYETDGTTANDVTVNVGAAGTLVFNTGFARVYKYGEQPKPNNNIAYEVRTAQQLGSIIKFGTGELKNYKFIQTHDIVFDTTTSASYTAPYLSTGSEYDGQGYRILELSVSKTYDTKNQYIGLFGRVSGKVSNVVLYSPSGTATISSSKNAGGIAGQLDSSGTITNCVVAGYKITAASYAGGIVGDNNGGTISSCEAVNVLDCGNNSSAYVGGIAGYGRGTIKDCYAGGSIENANVNSSGQLRSYVGGIYGRDSNAKVSNCYSYVSLTKVSTTTISNYNSRLFSIGQNYSKTDCYYLSSNFPTGETGVVEKGTAQTYSQLAGLTISGSDFGEVGATYTDSLTASTDSYPFPAIFKYGDTTYEHYGYYPTGTTPSAAALYVEKNSSSGGGGYAYQLVGIDENGLSVSADKLCHQRDSFELEGSGFAYIYASGVPDPTLDTTGLTEDAAMAEGLKTALGAGYESYTVTAYTVDTGAASSEKVWTLTNSSGGTMKVYFDTRFATVAAHRVTGTRTDPYTVRTVEQLQNIGTSENKFYRQTHDISGIGGGHRFTAFKPISLNGGGYDGGGYRIINLTINEVNDAAIFSSVNGELRNMIVYGPLEAAEVQSKNGDAAGLVANLTGGSITNCAVAGYNITGAKNVGGIAAVAAPGTTISHCEAVTAITASYAPSGVGTDGGVDPSNWKDAKAGGIAGVSGGRITDCYAGGSIVAGRVKTYQVGGIAGSSEGSALSIGSCYSYMNMNRLTTSGDNKVFAIGPLGKVDWDRCAYYAGGLNGGESIEQAGQGKGMANEDALSKWSKDNWPGEEANHSYHGGREETGETFPFRPVVEYKGEYEHYGHHELGSVNVPAIGFLEVYSSANTERTYDTSPFYMFGFLSDKTAYMPDPVPNASYYHNMSAMGLMLPESYNIDKSDRPDDTYKSGDNTYTRVYYKLMYNGGEVAEFYMEAGDGKPGVLQLNTTDPPELTSYKPKGWPTNGIINVNGTGYRVWWLTTESLNSIAGDTRARGEYGMKFTDNQIPSIVMTIANAGYINSPGSGDIKNPKEWAEKNGYTVVETYTLPATPSSASLPTAGTISAAFTPEDAILPDKFRLPEAEAEADGSGDGNDPNTEAVGNRTSVAKVRRRSV